MILHDKKCIFIHVPKTAGKTIRGIIMELREGWEKANHEHNMKPHIDIAEVQSIVSPEIFKSYFKFGFVRNPWDRAVSLFNNRKARHKQKTFEDFVNVFHNSSDFCKWPSLKKYQLDWFKDVNGNVEMDFIGRFESLTEDMIKICRKLNIDPVEYLIHEHNNNLPGKKHYSEYYNYETREIVYSNFKEDVEYFGYKFDD